VRLAGPRDARAVSDLDTPSSEKPRNKPLWTDWR
jgi:hypothetical protein